MGRREQRLLLRQQAMMMLGPTWWRSASFSVHCWLLEGLPPLPEMGRYDTRGGGGSGREFMAMQHHQALFV